MGWSDDFIAANPVPQVVNSPRAVSAPATVAQSAPQTPPPGVPMSALTGFANGLAQVGSGVEQGFGNLANIFGRNAVGDYLNNDAAWAQGEAQKESSTAKAAHPLAFGAGTLAGQIVGTAPTLAIGPEYAGLSTLGKIGLGAVQGAAGGAMLPMNDSGNFWANKALQMGEGGLLGAVLPTVTGAGKVIGSGLWGAVQPLVQGEKYVGNGMAGMMSPADAAAAAANIRGAQQFVPGSFPTTAQVAQTPFMVQTEKAAANLPAFKTAMAQRAIDNNDARWNALMGVAGTPADIQAAEAARTAAASPLYDAAHAATANVGPAFMRYAQIPEMQEAMQRANSLASLNAATGRGVAPVWPTPQSKTINGAALAYTSRALDDMIGEAANQPSRAGALRALQQKVDGWTQSYIPGVQQADAAYAAGSVPINTMRVGQQIANGLGTRAMNAGGAPEIQMPPFRSALTQAMNSGDAAKYGIDAGALQTLQGIGQDLQRATVSNSIRSPGSDTAYNLGASGWLARNLYGPGFNGATGIGKALAAVGALVTGHPMAAGGILAGGSKVGQVVGGRLQGHLSNFLMDPSTILPYLDARAAAPAQPIPQSLMQGLLSYGRPAAVNAVTGGLNEPNNH